MTDEERNKKIKKICENSINKFGKTMSEVVANAIYEGYKLGIEEVLSRIEDNKILKQYESICTNS